MDSSREDQYRELLFRHLGDRPEGEIAFFVNGSRFDVLRRTLGDKLAGKSVLNLGCGPFALEFYVGPDCARIDSIDIDPLDALHADMVGQGLIAPSSFRQADVMTFEPERTYDVIIINDVLYSKYVDFPRVVAKYAACLKPGGHFYFDVLDHRAGPIWAIVNNDARYRRYRIAEVTRVLGQHGMRIEAQEPSFGIKGGVDRLARKALWTLARVSNNVIFLARKSAVAASALLVLMMPPFDSLF